MGLFVAYKSSSDAFVDANVQLAIASARLVSARVPRLLTRHRVAECIHCNQLRLGWCAACGANWQARAHCGAGRRRVQQVVQDVRPHSSASAYRNCTCARCACLHASPEDALHNHPETQRHSIRRGSVGGQHVAGVEGQAFSYVAAFGPIVTGRRRRRFRAALELTDGLSMGYLKESRRGVLGFMGLFRGADAEGTIPPAEAAARAGIFLAVNASSVELVDVERYCGEYVGARPLVLWNIELDTLRSDLGAPLRADAERRCCCVHSRVVHSAESEPY